MTSQTLFCVYDLYSQRKKITPLIIAVITCSVAKMVFFLKKKNGSRQIYIKSQGAQKNSHRIEMGDRRRLRACVGMAQLRRHAPTLVCRVNTKEVWLASVTAHPYCKTKTWSLDWHILQRTVPSHTLGCAFYRPRSLRQTHICAWIFVVQYDSEHKLMD